MQSYFTMLQWLIFRYHRLFTLNVFLYFVLCRKCIIDKNARIGKNVTISNAEGVEEADRTSEGFYIRSGITVVLKNSIIADGLVI